jgi:hypothetical protein
MTSSQIVRQFGSAQHVIMAPSSCKLPLLVAACVALLAAHGGVAAECSGPEAYGDAYAVEQKAEGLTPKLENGMFDVYFLFSSSSSSLHSPLTPFAFLSLGTPPLPRLLPPSRPLHTRATNELRPFALLALCLALPRRSRRKEKRKVLAKPRDESKPSHFNSSLLPSSTRDRRACYHGVGGGFGAERRVPGPRGAAVRAHVVQAQR